MKRVLTAVVLVPLVLLVVFRAPLWLFAVVIALLAILALHEYLHISKACGLAPVQPMVYTIAVLIIFATLLGSESEPFADSLGWVRLGLASLSIILPILFGIPLVFRSDLRTGLSSMAASLFGVLYIVMPLSLLITLRAHPFQKILVPFILLSVWAGDTAAFYVGRTIGRHKLAPVVSPGKTWEGAIASTIASVATAILVLHFREPLGKLFTSFWTMSPFQTQVAPTHIIGIGIVTNIAAQFGDLFESAIKRGAQLKDSGALIPGHGGVLDRIDALLFAIPAVWYYAMLTHLLEISIFLIRR